MLMTDKELSFVSGGAFSWKFVAGVLGGSITFLIGVLDGIFRPLSCK